MTDTDAGMITDVNLLLVNAVLAMFVTELGITTETRDLFRKAPSEIAVTGTPPMVPGISTLRGQAGLAESLPS